MGWDIIENRIYNTTQYNRIEQSIEQNKEEIRTERLKIHSKIAGVTSKVQASKDNLPHQIK